LLNWRYSISSKEHFDSILGDLPQDSITIKEVEGLILAQEFLIIYVSM